MKNILVVDDNVDNAVVLRVLIRNTSSNRVYVAHRASTAIEMASNVAMDIVLMDFQLPDMDGHDAAIIIKEMNPQTKIFCVSGYSRDFIPDTDVFDGYLRKPFVFESIQQLFSEVLP